MTEQNIEKYSVELSRRHWTIVLIFLVYIITFFTFQNYIRIEKAGLAKKINDSGRQRMLSHKILLFKKKLSINSSESINNKFKNSLLIFNDSHNKLKINSHGKIKKYYKTILAVFMLNEYMSINALIGSLIVLFCVALLPFEKQIKRKLKFSLIRKVYFAVK